MDEWKLSRLSPSGYLRSTTSAQAMAIAEALFATEAGPPPPDRIRWLGRELDDFLGCIGVESRNTYRSFLFAVSALAPVMMRTATPLGAMELGMRIEALEKIDRSWASGALLAVKAALCVLYYEHPDVMTEIGIDDSCLMGAEP